MKLQTTCLIVTVVGVATLAGIRIGRAMAAEDSEYSVLRALPGVYAVVNKPTTYAEAAGLSQQALQQDLEGTLKKAGIRLLSRTEWQAAPGRPLLLARVSVLRDTATKPDKVNQVSLALVEDCTPVRTVALEAPSITYHDDTFGVGSVSDMRAALRGLAEKFAAEYRKQNPKK